MPRAFSKAEVEEFFARLKKMIPEPKTELNSVNPYTLLVAVVLSAQATDKGVNKATEPLFKSVDSVREKRDTASILSKSPKIGSLSIKLSFQILPAGVEM